MENLLKKVAGEVASILGGSFSVTIGEASYEAAPAADAGAGLSGRALARYFDHTLLKPDAMESEVLRICEEARENGFASVCVNSSYVPLCHKLLSGTGVAVCTVVGFPLGAMSTAGKVAETADAVANGADEIDMVLHIGRLRGADYRYVRSDIEAVVKAAGGKLVKVIIETALLTQEQKIAACLLSKSAGAHFVKTSTGFSGGGATVDDIRLMRRVVGSDMGVKASGRVRDAATARALIAAGASRIGASGSVAIIRETTASSNY